MAAAIIAHLRRPHAPSSIESPSIRAFADFLDPKGWLGNFNIEMLMLDG